MTTTTLPLASEPRPFAFGRVVTAFFEGVVEGREIATRYERLRHMSDAALARLGLTRQDIPRAAVNGVAGL